MAKRRNKSFRQVATLLESLPTEFIGELFVGLIKTMAEKYGDEDFELDDEIVENQFLSVLSYVDQGHDYNKIAELLMSRGKLRRPIWEMINKSIFEHIPEVDRAGLIKMVIANGKVYVVTPRETKQIDPPGSGDAAKEKWNSSLQEAAYKVRELYEADLKMPVREFKDLKDASNHFFDTHSFVKYPIDRLKKANFYELVKKSRGISVKEREP